MAAGRFPIVEELTEPSHPSLKALYAYWLSKKGAAPAPPRSAIRPEEIVPLLPDIVLLDVVGDPPRFRIRLIGTGVVAAYGKDVTGEFIDEIDLDLVGGEVLAQLERAVREFRPQIYRLAYTKTGDQRHLEYERMWLPLSPDGKTVTMLLGAFAVAAAYASLTPPPR